MKPGYRYKNKIQAVLFLAQKEGWMSKNAITAYFKLLSQKWSMVSQNVIKILKKENRHLGRHMKLKTLEY